MKAGSGSMSRAPGSMGGRSLWNLEFWNLASDPQWVTMTVKCAYPPAGYEVVRSDINLSPGAVVRYPSWCPKGKVVLSGGAQRTGQLSMFLEESGPVTLPGLPAGWLNVVQNIEEDPLLVTMSVVCANPPTGYVIRQATTTVAAGHLGSAEADCGPGRLPYSGGVTINDPVTGTHVMMFGSGTHSDTNPRWAGSAFNYDRDRAHTMTVSAIYATP